MIKTDGFLNDTSEKLPPNYLCGGGEGGGRGIHQREYSVGSLHTTEKNKYNDKNEKISTHI